MRASPEGTRPALLIVANWRSDVGYAWWFMERIWAALAEEFNVRGGKTHIIFPKVGALSPILRAAPVAVHELDYSARTRENKARMERLIHQEQIRSIYLTDRSTLDFFNAQLRLWGIERLVVNDQTPGDRHTSLFRRTAKALLHSIRVFSCDLCVAPSRFVWDRLLTVYALPSSRCVLIPNGIDPPDLAAADPGYAHRVFDLPDDAKIVVSLSRAVHYKGIGFIIDCADQLINRDGLENLYFLHCGDGPDLDAFREKVHNLGLERRFLLPGARPDYREILPSCDVAFHASQGEGFSLAVLECMASNLAILVPNNSGNREAVEHSISGYLYQPGNLKEAVGHLTTLLKDDNVRDSLGRAARGTVLEKFTIERTLAAYREIVAGFLFSGQRTW